MNRRQISLAIFATVGLGIGLQAHSEPIYPDKPVRIVVGYAPGGPTDMVARLLAAKLQDAMGQPFIVDNKAGAGSNIASEMVATAPADGYTLLVAAAPITMNGFVYKGQKFNVEKSFEAVSKLSSAPGILAVRPTLGVNSVAELIALAKKSDGKLSYGSTGLGGSQHMAGEQLQSLTGIHLTHVPYKGASAAMVDLMAGNIDMAFMTATSAMPNLQAGKIKPLAVAGPARLRGLPKVPTFSEAGFPAMVSDSWNGLFVPAGMPAPIVKKLHGAVAAAMNAPDLKEKLEIQGATVVASSPTEFKAELGQEVAHWKEQFKALKIEPK